MSRKKPEKRNIKIGIFTDKSKAYNQAILETLYSLQAATTWQIAKNIQEKQKPTENREIRDSRAHKIYSVIQRKGGRLNDLEEKGYVTSNEGLWMLTIKGNIALAIIKPGLLNEHGAIEEGIIKFEEALKNMPEGIAHAPLGISIDRGHFKKDFPKISNQLRRDPSVFKLIVEETRQLLLEGINLDAINEYSLASLLLARKSVANAIFKLSRSLS